MSEAWKIDLVLFSAALGAVLLVLGADITVADVAVFLVRLVP